MVDETFMLLSMKDSKAVADAISNKTAQKIIAYLTEHKESTESELSKELKVPLPTVHYNIQQLKKAKLIEAKEFFWSKKGKEMLVYKLAKKYIIISPDSSEGTLSKLKNILPITLLSLVGSGAVYLYQKTKFIASDTQLKATESFAEVGRKTITDNIPTQTISDCTIPEPNYALWFLGGTLFIILTIFLISLFRKK
jgi:DNA-binding transcriptional ArsR family regulator|tara:strand:+ start:55 stop:642 length:588 start_codon:yes stop_codon:yes gene_type:complete